MQCPDDKILKLCIVGRLTPQQLGELEKHLESCPACSERLAELEAGPNIPILDDIREAHRSGSESGTMDGDTAISPDIPRSIGHYNVLDVLGSGGMGTVYSAENPHLDRKVAIKVVKPSRRIHQSSLDRFSREMKAVGKLHHPNIVQALDGGVVDGQPYLVMEYLEGCDLSNFVKEHGPLSIQEACDIIRQVAAGLNYAHRLGFIHRDVKPSNLWLTHDGTVKILDFGLVGLLESEVAELPNGTPQHETVEGVILGTLDYISPEQAKSSKEADNRSDIYSLGCTFFYLLTGQPPFDKTTHPTLDNKLEGHANEDLPPLQQYRNDVPASVENVLRKMVAKRPEDRYQLASDILFSSSQTKRHFGNRLRWALTFLIIALIPLSMLFFLSGIYQAPNDNTKQVIPSTQQTALTDQASKPNIQPETIPVIDALSHSISSDTKPDSSVATPAVEEKTVSEKFPRLHPDDPNWRIVQILNVGTGFFNSAYFASDETIVEADDNGMVQLWNVTTGKLLRQFDTGKSAVKPSATSFALASDKSTFASGLKNGTVELWELNADQPFYSYWKNGDSIRSLCFSNDSRKLFSLSNDLDILDIESKQFDVTKPVINKGVVFYPCGSCFGPKDEFVFFSIANRVGMYDILDERINWPDSIPSKPPILSMKIFQDCLAIPSGESRIWMNFGLTQDLYRKNFPLWGKVTGSNINQVTGEVNSVAFFPNRKWMLSGGKDTPVNLWAYSDGSTWYRSSNVLVQSFALDDSKDSVIALDCSPNGRKFLIRTKDNPQIIVWEYAGEYSQNGTNK